VDLKEGDRLDIIVSTDNPEGKNVVALFEKELDRKLKLLNGIPNNLLRQLVLAADQFVVKRTEAAESEGGTPIDFKTVIAGYHWFTDWGRDTMISLPGLCLTTGRFEDAKKIIAVFGKSVSMGMLPNRFIDGNNPPEYNNVDGTLWYFNAVYNYLQVTDDKDFILNEILPVLTEIIEWHFKGTRFNIHVDSDGLLYAGEKGQQLTWMDARINDWVVTPRMGKPVEIEALWYNALKIFHYVLLLNNDSLKAGVILENAESARKSFGENFWYHEGGYLYDNIDELGKPDASLRPNQIFTISLPFPLLDGEKAKSVLNIIRSKLFTTVGLRSLSPDDPDYKGSYGGDAFKRDSAYHQGTVWSWLLGPFIEAGIKTFGEGFKSDAKDIIAKFARHLHEGCLGTVSEIFDGDEPHHSRGCVSQAWGVAEVLRVIKTYSLFDVTS
jgi:predicted glycogen debranching enzyme